MTDQQLVRKLIWVVVIKCIVLGVIWWLFFVPGPTQEQAFMSAPQNQSTTGENRHGH